MFEIPMEILLVDGIGYAGAALSIWAMYGQTMIKLRLGVVIGNCVILVFGILAESWPTAIMHGLLLPLNTWRLVEMWRLIRDLRASSNGNLAYLEPLIPFMKTQSVKAGTVLFREGDPSDKLILIESGTVRLEGIGVTVGAGEMFGEMGLFTPENKRTGTAVCETDCLLATMSHESLMQLYYQNPQFGLSLVRVVVQRLLENWQNAEEDARARAAMV